MQVSPKAVWMVLCSLRKSLSCGLRRLSGPENEGEAERTGLTEATQKHEAIDEATLRSY